MMKRCFAKGGLVYGIWSCRRTSGSNRFGSVCFSVPATGLDRLGCASYGSHQFLNWWQQVSTGHLHRMGSSPSAFRHQKREARRPLFFGAGNRTRTGTLFTARDFKSLVSTDFTMPAVVPMVMIAYFSYPVKFDRTFFRLKKKARRGILRACAGVQESRAIISSCSSFGRSTKWADMPQSRTIRSL